MSVFVDTSAFYALLDEDDLNHRTAAALWTSALDEVAGLVTHTYVVVESTALVQRRLGAEAARRLVDGLLPALEVVNVQPGQHAEALGRWYSQLPGSLSLVDVTSFVVMEDKGLRTAFAFDRDFLRVGFEVLS